MNNTEFAATDERFRTACELAEIPPTKRQAGKFRRKTGAAFRAQETEKSMKLIRKEEK